STTEGAFCQIIDQNGRLMLEKKLPGDTGAEYYSFEVSGFPPGVYALRLQLKNGKAWATKRFVVAR
ncbi:MAG: hypothetical protein Q7U74_11555, partial [Saprospiraceae bacterium]|nr:hypothetical protein [Saprospiraceae bacterium]